MGAKTRTASYTHLAPDTRYGSVLVSKFINCLMWDGKKPTAMRVFYQAMDQIKKRMPDLEPVDVFSQAVEHVKPTVEVRASRSTTLGLRWLIQYSRARREKTMTERLMNELLDASNGLGASVKRREDMHKMAESNKAFAHYRW